MSRQRGRLRALLLTSARHLTEEETDRFLPKVRIGGRDECWWWTACTDRDGYGWFRLRGRGVGTHRIVLEAKIGRLLEPGEEAMHHCDNPRCVNPHHLSVGTRQQNADDMMRKGRHVAPRGEAHVMSKLSDSDVRSIRTWASLGYSFADIAEAFGIHPGHVRAIWRGRKRLSAGGLKSGCGVWQDFPAETMVST